MPLHTEIAIIPDTLRLLVPVLVLPPEPANHPRSRSHSRSHRPRSDAPSDADADTDEEEGKGRRPNDSGIGIAIAPSIQCPARPLSMPRWEVLRPHLRLPIFLIARHCLRGPRIFGVGRRGLLPRLGTNVRERRDETRMDGEREGGHNFKACGRRMRDGLRRGGDGRENVLLYIATLTLSILVWRRRARTPTRFGTMRIISWPIISPLQSPLF
ncbi:hypothetical protein B0H14DRAFT_3553270 [Mycena olivaceomarginata]|nr:hypothetical protein B0H14DRAFT_3553270 [Mycena olivaceomarginata]